MARRYRIGGGLVRSVASTSGGVRPHLGLQASDGIDEGSEARRLISVAGKVAAHPARSEDLLELRYHLHQRLRRAYHGVGIAEPCLAVETAKLVIVEGRREGSRLADVPRFELLAGDPNDGIAAPSLVAQGDEALLQGSTVPAIVVLQHHEPDPGLSPGTELARHAPL